MLCRVFSPSKLTTIMANQTVVHTHSFPVAFLLGIAFVILKLCGVISWSWLWVLAPFWIGIALCLALFVLIPLVALLAVAVFAGIAGIFGFIAKRWFNKN